MTEEQITPTSASAITKKLKQLGFRQHQHSRLAQFRGGFTTGQFGWTVTVRVWHEDKMAFTIKGIEKQLTACGYACWWLDKTLIVSGKKAQQIETEHKP